MVSNWRGSADLALVQARVPPLRVPHLQRPIICRWLVDGQKPQVTSIGVTTDGQQMNIPMPNP